MAEALGLRRRRTRPRPSSLLPVRAVTYVSDVPLDPWNPADFSDREARWSYPMHAQGPYMGPGSFYARQQEEQAFRSQQAAMQHHFSAAQRTARSLLLLIHP